MHIKSTLVIKIISIFMLLSLVILPGRQAAAVVLYKVGFIVDATGINDDGWNELAYEGVIRALAWVTPTVYANDNFLTSLNSCVSQGNALCIAANWGAGDAIKVVAAANPGVKFAILDTYIESPTPNLRYIMFDEKQVGYLAGVLATYMSNSYIIGAVGGPDVPAVVNFLEGYKNGAQCTDKNMIVMEYYTSTFNDPGLGATVAAAMIGQGADVIFGAGGATGSGAIVESAQYDVFSIGVDTDQYLSVFGNGAVDGSDKLLTSAMKKLDNAVWQTIDQATAGTFTGGEMLMDLENDGVGLAPYHETSGVVPNAIKGYVEDVADSIIAGTTQIDDPCAVTIWHPFTGVMNEIAMQQVIADVQTFHPNLPIHAFYKADLVNTYTNAAQKGYGPDLVIMGSENLSSLAHSGAVRNLESLLAGQLTNRYPAAVNAMRVDGDLYGVPESSQTVALFYDKSSITTPPTTTVELMNLLQSGKKLAAVGVDAGSYFFYGFWNAFGGQLMNNGGLCVADQAGVANAMQYLKNLQANGAVFQLDYATAMQGFEDGTYDMVINGPWALSDYHMALGNNLGVVALPSGPSGAAKPMLDLFGIHVNGYLGSPPEVIEMLVGVAMSMTNHANSQTFTNVAAHIPVRSDIVSSDPLVNTFALLGSNTDSRPLKPELENYWSPFNTHTLNILQGAETPAMGIQLACQEMNELNNFPAVSGSLGTNGANGRVAYSTGWTTALANGIYKFYIEPSWTGVITPTRPGFTFTPTSRPITIPVTTDLAGQNFSAAFSPSFADVSSAYWAYTWIERLFSSGVTTGCNPAAGLYCPENAVTRDQMAVFLERAMRGPTYNPPAPIGIFSDVPIAQWAAKYIEKLYADGITTGCNPPLMVYCPAQVVTRAQMAVFLLRAKYGPGFIPPNTTGIFTDVASTHWAAKWIEQLYREGITGGCNSILMQYCPEDPVTRSQMAVFLVRTFGLP